MSVDLRSWQVQLLPEELAQISPAARRARRAGIAFLACFFSAFILGPLALVLLPLSMVVAVVAVYWSVQARRSEPSLEQLATALGLHGTATPEELLQLAWWYPRAKQQRVLEYDSEFACGRLGDPAVEVQLLVLRLRCLEKQGSERVSVVNESVLATAAVPLPLRLLHLERRQSGQQVARRLTGILSPGADAELPTRELQTESEEFNRAWRVLVHADDDPQLVMRILSPEIIQALVENRVPLAQGLLVRDGRVLLGEPRATPWVRQVDHLLVSLLQCARFAEVLAREAGQAS